MQLWSAWAFVSEFEFYFNFFGLFFVKDISFLFYKFSRYLPDYNYIYIQKNLLYRRDTHFYFLHLKTNKLKRYYLV